MNDIIDNTLSRFVESVKPNVNVKPLPYLFGQAQATRLLGLLYLTTPCLPAFAI